VRQIVKAWEAQRKIVKMACPCSASYLCFVLADTLGILGRRFFFSLSAGEPDCRGMAGPAQDREDGVSLPCHWVLVCARVTYVLFYPTP